MNPKEMTNDTMRELARACSLFVEGFERLDGDATDSAMRTLRRLLPKDCEADALRKENEELRKDAERYRFIEANGDVVSINGSAWCGDTGLSREEIDEVMRYEAEFCAARLVKESEEKK